MKSTMGAVVAMILANRQYIADDMFPKIPQGKPGHYKVYIPKHLRKGKTYEELQEMRREIWEREHG